MKRNKCNAVSHNMTYTYVNRNYKWTYTFNFYYSVLLLAVVVTTYVLGCLRMDIHHKDRTG